MLRFLSLRDVFSLKKQQGEVAPEYAQYVSPRGGLTQSESVPTASDWDIGSFDSPSSVPSLILGDVDKKNSKKEKEKKTPRKKTPKSPRKKGSETKKTTTPRKRAQSSTEEAKRFLDSPGSKKPRPVPIRARSADPAPDPSSALSCLLAHHKNDPDDVGKSFNNNKDDNNNNNNDNNNNNNNNSTGNGAKSDKEDNNNSSSTDKNNNDNNNCDEDGNTPQYDKHKGEVSEGSDDNNDNNINDSDDDSDSQHNTQPVKRPYEDCFDCENAFGSSKTLEVRKRNLEVSAEVKLDSEAKRIQTVKKVVGEAIDQLQDRLSSSRTTLHDEKSLVKSIELAKKLRLIKLKLEITTPY